MRTEKLSYMGNVIHHTTTGRVYDYFQVIEWTIIGYHCYFRDSSKHLAGVFQIGCPMATDDTLIVLLYDAQDFELLEYDSETISNIFGVDHQRREETETRTLGV